MLSSGEVAGKVVPVSAPMATNVTLEGVFIAMATHVNCVEDVIGEVDVAVRAVLEQLWLVVRVWRSRLAVSATVTGRARPVAALPRMGRVPNVWRRCECHDGTGDVAGNCGRWLYKERGFFFREGVCTRRSRRLRREAGKLPGQSGELIEWVVFQIICFLHIFRSQTDVGTVQVIPLVVSTTVLIGVVFPVQA